MLSKLHTFLLLHNDFHEPPNQKVSGRPGSGFNNDQSKP